MTPAQAMRPVQRQSTREVALKRWTVSAARRSAGKRAGLPPGAARTRPGAWSSAGSRRRPTSPRARSRRRWEDGPQIHGRTRHRKEHRRLAIIGRRGPVRSCCSGELVLFGGRVTRCERDGAPLDAGLAAVRRGRLRVPHGAADNQGRYRGRGCFVETGCPVTRSIGCCPSPGRQPTLPTLCRSPSHRQGSVSVKSPLGSSTPAPPASP